MNKTTFRDMLMIILLGFVFMIMAMVPHLNPPPKDDAVKPPGTIIVHATWPPGNVDVDMWVTGPGEPKPVGYLNPSGVLWNLLRDDLGTVNDITPLNYENAYTRGIVAGEYIVNVHCYRCPPGEEVPVVVEVRIRKGAKLILVAVSKIKISPKQEMTAVRFLIDGKNNLVPKSINRVYRRLVGSGQLRGP